MKQIQIQNQKNLMICLYHLDYNKNDLYIYTNYLPKS
jgi:hypothetical protein